MRTVFGIMDGTHNGELTECLVRLTDSLRRTPNTTRTTTTDGTKREYPSTQKSREPHTPEEQRTADPKT
jgi:hypothetical protein